MKDASDLDFKISPNQLLREFPGSDIALFVKREDLLHPEVSGNKFRKLKYNLKEAKTQGKNKLLTFGGAFSNHIAAVAAAGRIGDLETIGIIRGEELGEDLAKTLHQNPTLQTAAAMGMKLQFISRADYRQKEDPEFIEKLKKQFGDFYLLPEGGTNALAIKGCEEILTEEDKDFDFICCPVGTGGTITGIINSSEESQNVLGFPALKADFLNAEIAENTFRRNWELQQEFHFGGYAKVSQELIRFMNDFRKNYHIQLDPVYTGKMFFGIFEMIQNSAFPQNSRILAIHTGGLQGISGMNKMLLKKNLPLIEV